MAPSRSQSFFEYVNIANSFSCKIPIKVRIELRSFILNSCENVREMFQRHVWFR